MNSKSALFVVLVTLFSLETSCSGSAFTSSDVDTANFNGGIKSSKIVPIDAIQGENLDQSFGARFTKEKAMLLVSQYSQKIPWHVRTLARRELVGLFSGSSTMGISKTMAGLILLAASLNSQSETLVRDEVGRPFSGNSTLSDVYSSMGHQSFLISSFEQKDLQTNKTSLMYKAYGISMQSSNTFSGLGMVAGICLIASGVSDFMGALHLHPSFKDSFESMVNEAVSKFSDDVVLTEKAFGDYLDYAYGGYIDAYQKRGIFNKNSLMYFLTQYKNWEKIDENA